MGGSKSYEYSDVQGYNEDWKLRIITINVPEIYLKFIKQLTDMCIYPSRSEALRVALRNFILDELKLVDKVKECNALSTEELEDTFVRVPIKDKDVEIVNYMKKNGFKNIRRLEY